MRLYLMQLSASKDGSVGGYLIQTDDGTNVLVDSGYPQQEYTENGIEENFVVNRLKEIGLAPEDIDIIVCTHLDVDHAGSHDLFPDAELVVQREHLDAGRSMQRFQGIREHWDHPKANFRTVDGDTELVPGVELIETSGHVPGHQAVLVRLPKTGPMLLAIDAISGDFTGYTPENRPTGQYDNDAEGTRRSTRKLVDLAERESAVIVRGHDGNQWKSLKRSPEYYE
jgi:N-acyl homoserine lactone hydrolase